MLFVTTAAGGDTAGPFKTRDPVEHFFCTLQQFRTIATRDDKTKRDFLAAVYLAASTIPLNWRHARVRH